MIDTLRITLGQSTDKGPKKINQDFSGAHIPQQPALTSKGIAICLADGISSSEVSQHASKASVLGFLEDYYSTPDTWSVKTSVQRVLKATNSWLYQQTRNSPYRYSPDRGYVCTFSAVVLKSNTAHIFHAGDTRVYRVTGNNLEQLTEDHRLWVSQDKSYLRRALGMKESLQLDYRNLSIDKGDTFIIATDGVYEFALENIITKTIRSYRNDLNTAADEIIRHALERGSDDNLSIQIIRIDQLPGKEASEFYNQASTLPFLTDVKPGMTFDGYEIIRNIHTSHRSHLFLATDIEKNRKVVIKVPSVDLRSNAESLERFLMEDWVARRVKSPYVGAAEESTHPRSYLYNVSEYIEGKSLRQWMTDNPKPEIEKVRDILEQIANGLRAFHRQEMLHQDIRPENIMIDTSGTAKIIDFGSTMIAGVSETSMLSGQHSILGTAQYAAPEYFIGETGSTRSDMFSLAVIAYEMLGGSLPYGPHIARATTRAAQRRLKYKSLLSHDRSIPVWLDGAVRKALEIDAADRYEEISEFIFDLRHPNRQFVNRERPPLLERNPVLFWKSISLVLFIIVIFLINHNANIN